jgi:hypothetical protein
MTHRIIDKDDVSVDLRAVLFPDGVMYRAISHGELQATMAAHAANSEDDLTDLIAEAEALVPHKGSGWLTRAIDYSAPSGIDLSYDPETDVMTVTSDEGIFTETMQANITADGVATGWLAPFFLTYVDANTITFDTASGWGTNWTQLEFGEVVGEDVVAFATWTGDIDAIPA